MTEFNQNPHYYQPRRPSTSAPIKRKRQTWKLYTMLVYIVIIAVCVVSVASAYARVAPMVAQIFAPKQASLKPSPIQSTQLANQINTILRQNNQYQIGVALEDISTKQTKTFGQNVPFEAASTAKVLTACAYYHLVETDQASLTTPMGPYDASFQLKEMINDSDNDAWTLLLDAIGLPQLQAYATSIGVTYDANDNTLSPSAQAAILTKLYSGQLLNQADTNQLLSYMQNTNDETLIPAVVPSDITVYHKYGLLNGELHDSAILVKGNQAYAFVVYTKGATDDSDDPARTIVIHQITTAVTGSLFLES